MKPPKVTVIIPNFNHAGYLKKRIQSVLDQTYRDFEVLYLDDASTDDSQKVFADFEADSRIRAILNSKNSGTPFKQWNKGVQEARGEYIWIAEADDYADLRFLETLVPLLDENPQVGIAYCNSWMVDRSDDIFGLTPQEISFAELTAKRNASPPEMEMIRWDRWDTAPWSNDFVASGKEFYRHLMIYENKIPNASAVLFRKGVYQAAGGADESMRVCGDYMAWIRMLQQADVAFCNRALNSFRTHPASVRSTSNKSGMWAFERYQVSHYILKDLSLSPAEADHLCHIRMSHWLEDVFSPTRRSNCKYSLAIIGLARDMDVKFASRLLWQSIYYWLRRSPFLGAARSLGRRFFWRSRSTL